MDVGRSFTYMLKQPGGVGKLIVAGLLLFIPIIGWAIVGGYMVRTLREVAQGDEQLPDWSNVGDLLTKGLLLWVGGFIYNVPGLVLGRAGDAGGFLSFLWSIFVFVVLPAAIIRFALTEDFGSFFQFGQIKTFIQDNLNNYIMAVVLALVAGFVAGFGIILIIVGVVFTIAWAMLVSAHLYGSVWANRVARPALSSPASPTSPPEA